MDDQEKIAALTAQVEYDTAKIAELIQTAGQLQDELSRLEGGSQWTTTERKFRGLELIGEDKITSVYWLTQRLGSLWRYDYSPGEIVRLDATERALAHAIKPAYDILRRTAIAADTAADPIRSAQEREMCLHPQRWAYAPYRPDHHRDAPG